MYCSNCGQKLNDNAKFCFNCGQKVTSNVKDNELEKKKVISFKIGENYVAYNKDEIKEIVIRSVFERNASICERYLLSYGKLEIMNFEDLYGKLYEEYINLMKQNLQIATRMLIGLGIYTYDQETISKLITDYYDLEEGLELYYEDLKTIESKILEINEGKQYRSSRPGPWTGGGFGITGAIKGSIKAGVLNAGHKMLGKIEDGIVNSLDKKELIQLKQACLNSGNALYELSQVLYQSVCAIGEIIYDILINEGIVNKNNWWSTEKTYAQRNNMISLYNNKQLDSSVIKEKLCECFQNNPFNVLVLRDLFKIYEPLEGDLQNLMNFFGYEQGGFVYKEFYNMDIYCSDIYYLSFYYGKNENISLDSGDEQLNILKMLDADAEILEIEKENDDFKYPSKSYYRCSIFDTAYNYIVKSIVESVGENSIYVDCLRSIGSCVKDMIVCANYEIEEAINFSYDRFNTYCYDELKKKMDWQILEDIMENINECFDNVSDLIDINGNVDAQKRFESLWEMREQFN